MNRGEVLRAVDGLTTRHGRIGQQTAVLFCDIDRFKDINDVHGHAAGDEVLRALSERVRLSIRADDHAARIGGDELLVVLAGISDLDAATDIAEKIRTAAAQPIDYPGGVTLATTMSIGVTLARPGETTDALIERADTAMYRAKQSGRDQVVTIP